MFKWRSSYLFNFLHYTALFFGACILIPCALSFTFNDLKRQLYCNLDYEILIDLNLYYNISPNEGFTSATPITKYGDLVIWGIQQTSKRIIHDFYYYRIPNHLVKEFQLALRLNNYQFFIEYDLRSHRIDKICGQSYSETKYEYGNFSLMISLEDCYRLGNYHNIYDIDPRKIILYQTIDQVRLMIVYSNVTVVRALPFKYLIAVMFKPAEYILGRTYVLPMGIILEKCTVDNFDQRSMFGKEIYYKQSDLCKTLIPGLVNVVIKNNTKLMHMKNMELALMDTPLRYREDEGRKVIMIYYEYRVRIHNYGDFTAFRLFPDDFQVVQDGGWRTVMLVEGGQVILNKFEHHDTRTCYIRLFNRETSKIDRINLAFQLRMNLSQTAKGGVTISITYNNEISSTLYYPDSVLYDGNCSRRPRLAMFQFNPQIQGRLMTRYMYC